MEEKKRKGDEETPPPNVLKEQFDGVEKLYKKLEKTLDGFYKTSGLSSSKVSEYLDNSNNFNDSEWKIVQSRRKYFQDILSEQLDPEFRKKEELKKRKKKKRKLRGRDLGRKRKWLEMD